MYCVVVTGTAMRGTAVCLTVAVVRLTTDPTLLASV